MRASTAFLVGVGTVGLAIVGGLGGGLVIGNMMSPSAPKHDVATAPPARPAPPQPMSASAALPYVAAALAFSDPSIDGSAPPSAARQADGGTTSSPPASVAAAAPGDQAAKPAAPQEAQQVPSARPASSPENAYAKARDSGLKHEAYKRRAADRAQRWAHRHDQNQNADQQARDDRSGDDSDAPSSYSINHSDHRYRDDSRDRYRDGDDRGPGYYVDQAPRTGFPRIQLFGSDD